MPKGILVNYDWCTGCHSCEMACQVEQDLPIGQYGVKVTQVGPYNVKDDDWVWINMPVFTEQCDLCAERVSKGKLPSCVQHCQAAIMKYGEVEDLAKDLAENPKQVLYCLS